ncbi:MAG: hypothetical protein KDB61_11720, partial [Planctomycetes bacterium]|nr:hypothetical protein [Planctomycetota bacterium]
MEEEQLYLALIGDMVASRELPDRKRAQQHLIEAIQQLNSRPELGMEALAAPLTLTAGDEVQALIRRPETTMTLIQELTDRFGGAGKFPVFVFGLGLGTLSTGLIPVGPGRLPNPAIEDGPCFHLARAALEAAKKERRWVRCMGFEPRVDTTLNAI